MHCIITGCALVHNESWVAGDLFELGSHYYIFIGNIASHLQPSWYEGPPSYSKQLSPTSFECKRGIFFIHKHEANLNQQAQDYINGTL